VGGLMRMVSPPFNHLALYIYFSSPYLRCPHPLVFFGLDQAHGHVGLASCPPLVGKKKK